MSLRVMGIYVMTMSLALSARLYASSVFTLSRVFSSS